MRDLMMLGGLLCLLPLAIGDAFVAYLLWGWTALASPAYFLYGFLSTFRFNLLFAACALGLLFIGRLRNHGKPAPTRTTILLLLFFCHASVCAYLSLQPNPHNATYYEMFFKALWFALLMPVFVTSRGRIHALLIAIGLGLGLHGAAEGLKVLVTAGTHQVAGLPTTMLSDNNHFAVGMAIAIPILYYLQQYSRSRLAHLGFMAGVFLTVIAILGTHSRGGFLSLAVVGLWIAFTSRRKGLAMFSVLAGAVLVMAVAPESWFSRIGTLEAAGEDLSFQGRLAAWKISSAIALANPVFGGGIHAVQVQWIWDSFRTADNLLGFVPVESLPETAKAAHSIYFEILGDQGFVGLLLFVALLFSALVTYGEIKRLVARRGPEYFWARDLADMLAAAVVAYMVGGAGVSLGYLEIFYAIVMLLETVKICLKREIAAGLGGAAPPPAKAPPRRR